MRRNGGVEKRAQSSKVKMNHYCVVERRKAYSQDEARQVGVGWEAPMDRAATQALSQFSPVTCSKENHQTKEVSVKAHICNPRTRLQAGIDRTSRRGPKQSQRPKESQGAGGFGRPLLCCVESSGLFY